jgi:hypothetical protein
MLQHERELLPSRSYEAEADVDKDTIASANQHCLKMRSHAKAHGRS